MLPEIAATGFGAGPLRIETHGLFVLLGTLAAVLVFVLGARRRGELDDPLANVLLGALVGGALGAKLSVLGRYLDLAPVPSLAGLLVSGGKSVLGGLAGAYFGALASKRLLGIRRPTGDLFAPAVALGIGLGRIGCLLTETPGTPTGGSWGVRVDAPSAALLAGFPREWIGVPLHPSFLYEIPFHLAMSGLLLALRSRGLLPGDLFKLYLLAYGTFRFAVEFVRGNPVVWHGLTGSQLFLIPSVLLLAAYFLRRFRRPTSAVLEAADA